MAHRREGLLGWAPKPATLLADLKSGYFTAQASIGAGEIRLGCRPCPSTDMADMFSLT